MQTIATRWLSVSKPQNNTEQFITPQPQLETNWADNSIWWHVYPLGFCGAPIRPESNNSEPVSRLKRLTDYLDYAVELGVTGLLLGPIFKAQTHGYDTLDHYQIDPRLGTDQDFDDLITAANARGLHIVLDGVFSHVGVDHPWLQADLSTGPGVSDLFDIDFSSWETAGHGTPRVWEGHGSLARLNHASDTAVTFVAGVMRHWLGRGIAGWRLDAAYSVPQTFWTQVAALVRQDYPQAWLLGEVIHGDYSGFVAGSGVDTTTQYELWKAIWSALHDNNLFELDWAIRRHNELLDNFIPHTFIGNHDVTRIASKIGAEKALLAASILFTLGGIPSVYAGDEQAFLGVKENRLGGDDAVRPKFPSSPVDLRGDSRTFDAYRDLIRLRRDRPWLATAKTTKLELTCTKLVYSTSATSGDGRLDVEIDLDANKATIWENAQPLLHL
ncbi:MAG: alpha-amylase [Cellulomonadaceae bacterium]|jgi:glycosidase|nr:alpha-amylase [Cellulomonadaceae bacterium]